MKPTINEIERAKKIVEGLVAHGFLDIVRKEDTCGIYKWSEDNSKFLKEEGIKTACGETKFCIIPDILPDWVIKVGCNYYDEDICSKITDFCHIELTNFESAVEEDLDEFFAAIYELCVIDDVTFYIQERAAPDEEKTTDSCREYMGYKDEPDEDEEEYVDPNFDDYDRVESLFHGPKLEELFSFIDRWHINDLHEGNFGFTVSGVPKIIDYSGY